MFNKYDWTSKNGRHYDVWASLFNFDIKDINCTRNLKYICNDLRKCLESNSSNPNHRVSLRLSSYLVEGTARLHRLKAEQLLRDCQRFLNLNDAKGGIVEEETIGIEGEVSYAPTTNLNLLDPISNVESQPSTLNSSRPCEELEPFGGDIQEHDVGDSNILPKILVRSPSCDHLNEHDGALRVQSFHPGSHSSPHMQFRSRSSSSSESELPTVVLEESSVLDEDGPDDDGATKNIEPTRKDSSDTPEEDESITRKNTATVYAEMHDPPIQYSAIETGNQLTNGAVEILKFRDSAKLEIGKEPTSSQSSTVYSETHDPHTRHSACETGSQPSGSVMEKLPTNDSPPAGDRQTPTMYTEIHDPPIQYSASETGNQPSDGVVKRLTFRDSAELEIGGEISDDNSLPTGVNQTTSVHASTGTKRSASTTANNESGIPQKKTNIDGAGDDSESSVDDLTSKGDDTSENSVNDATPKDYDDDSERFIEDPPLTGDEQVLSLVFPAFSSLASNPNNMNIVIGKLSAHKNLYKHLQKK